ncbi:MAG: tRNA (adenosine(37)-N6)-threonylcarbamoyltransferase complex dimerization subunit type 1 TsaB [Lachnospiraceae bacterium]|nr:tRNA (adenosine(37)-N6)-threonylcarbamoyltransferase complex dimerization subunit type 1 TsaB [Lachnospiraceae bacterium]
MKILALDSSGMVASVALLTEEQLIGEYTINYKKTHSQTLLPMLNEVKQMTELDLAEIDAIAVAAGPGSFTGLRIGSATAKGLGLALNKPLISVPTLEGLAYQFWGSKDWICPIMDARRNQVYTGVYRFVETEEQGEVSFSMETLMPQSSMDVQELINWLNEHVEGKVVFLGDGVPVYHKQIADGLHKPYSLAPAHRNRQSAAALGMLAVEYFKQGKVETAAEHEPDYLRVSQAERERMEREGK